MSSPENSHELYEQLAAGHALSALEPEDEHAFLGHLPQCAACLRALADHTETLAHLAYAVDESEPPASLLEGIRTGIAESGRAGHFPPPLSLDAARVRLRDRTVRWTTAVVGMAASLVLLVSLVFVNHGLTSQQHDAQLAAARLNTTVSSLLVPGARKITLAGSNGGKGAVVVNGHDISLVMADIPVNDRTSSIYVLWEKSRSGSVHAVGTFDIRSADLAVVNHLQLTQEPSTVEAFIVTREQGRMAPPFTTQPAVVSGQA